MSKRYKKYFQDTDFEIDDFTIFKEDVLRPDEYIKVILPKFEELKNSSFHSILLAKYEQRLEFL
jgi:hypothetical protein